MNYNEWVESGKPFSFDGHGKIVSATGSNNLVRIVNRIKAKGRYYIDYVWEFYVNDGKIEMRLGESESQSFIIDYLLRESSGLNPESLDDIRNTFAEVDIAKLKKEYEAKFPKCHFETDWPIAWQKAKAQYLNEICDNWESGETGGEIVMKSDEK